MRKNAFIAQTPSGDGDLFCDGSYSHYTGGAIAMEDLCRHFGWPLGDAAALREANERLRKGRREITEALGFRNLQGDTVVPIRVIVAECERLRREHDAANQLREDGWRLRAELAKHKAVVKALCGGETPQDGARWLRAFAIVGYSAAEDQPSFNAIAEALDALDPEPACEPTPKPASADDSAELREEYAALHRRWEVYRRDGERIERKLAALRKDYRARQEDNERLREENERLRMIIRGETNTREWTRRFHREVGEHEATKAELAKHKAVVEALCGGLEESDLRGTAHALRHLATALQGLPTWQNGSFANRGLARTADALEVLDAEPACASAPQPVQEVKEAKNG